MEWGVQIRRALTPDDVDALLLAGVQRVTVPLPWGWAERQQGRWYFEAIDHFLAPLRAAGIPLQGLLGPGISEHWPPWVVSQGGAAHPDYIEHFASYCAALAARCEDISVFRVEEDLNAAFWWEGVRTRRRRGACWRDAGFRRKLLGAACQAVRDQRPDAELRITVRPGIPGWRKDLIRTLRSGIPVSRVGLTLPASSVLPDPEIGRNVGDRVEEVRDLLDSSGHEAIDVEVARCAYPTHRDRFSPKGQREFLVVAAAAAAEAGSVGFHWWALRDQAHDDPILGYWTPEAERHMGLLYYDSTPKPSMDEFRVLATGDRFGQGRA